MGSAPFGHAPGGEFNFPRPDHPVRWLEDSPRRVRGVRGGETVVDSRRVKLLFETGSHPAWYFPREDVRLELLEEPDLLDAGPAEDFPVLGGFVGLRWDAMDTWLEEDEEVYVHVRDPYHRVDVIDTSRRVRVLMGDEVLADTTRAKALFETALPPRWYIPAEDCRDDLLVDVDLTTACPYKGEAGYRSARAGGREELAIAWMYPEPIREVAPIAGHWCFFQEREGIVVEVDGEVDESAPTPWSSDAWARQVLA